MKRIFSSFSTLLLAYTSIFAQQKNEISLSDSQAMKSFPYFEEIVAVHTNCVPNKWSAVRIAEAVWFPFYGKSIYREKPFKARELNKDTWVVEGTVPKGAIGAQLYIEISKSDGKILRVARGK